MKVLIVIDMQHDFIDGVLGSPEAQAIVPNVVAKVAQYAADSEGVVMYTMDSHLEDYMDTMEGHYLPVPHCIVGTHGWEVIPEVKRDDIETVYHRKPNFGSLSLPHAIMAHAGMVSGSSDVDSIELVGVCTDICVITNALLLKTYYNDIPIKVDSSCCAGVTPAKHEAALEVMRSCQIEVI